MPTSFEDSVGEADVSVRHAVAHLTGWFQPSNHITLVGIRSQRIDNKQNVVSQVWNVKELVDTLRGEEGELFLQERVSGSSGRWDVYLSVAPVDPDKADTGSRRRGGLDLVDRVLGVYADLDVKQGAFSSEEEILEWLKQFPRATMVTATGSGGVHAWWKVKGGMTPEEGRDVQRRWWTLLSERAGESKVDHLVDTSRLLRLAGSVRWPKPGEDGDGRMVRVVYRSREEYDVEVLRSMTEDSVRRRDEKVRETRAKDDVKITWSDLGGLGDGQDEWSRMFAMATIDDQLDELLSWEDILIPQGWTLLGTDHSGRRNWARPGSRSKSGSTDYDGSNVLSLHSWSEETGLSDLKEAGIVLSKTRVACRLLFNDDRAALVRWVLEQK